MELKNFDQIVERAKQSFRKQRVVIAGADSENILLGAFEAQDAGFATPVLVGEAEKIEPMLERLGLKDKTYRLVATQPGEDVIQTAVDIVRRGEGDVLMRGNTQTRDFLMALLDKKNELRTDKRLVQIDLVSMPEYPKLIAIGDVTVTIEPNLQQKKQIIRSMAETLEAVGYDKPNIALLSMVEEVNYHMEDSMEAQPLHRSHANTPIANCNLVGYDQPLCGEFDGIVAPSLLAGNLIVKGWQMHAKAKTCGVVVGAKVPVALTSRSDSKEVSFLSLAFCAALDGKA